MHGKENRARLVGKNDLVVELSGYFSMILDFHNNSPLEFLKLGSATNFAVVKSLP